MRHPRGQLLSHGKAMDCAEPHGDPVDCAMRTGPSALPTGSPQGPLGAPALWACPQPSHSFGLRLETASRFPQLAAPFKASIKVSYKTRKQEKKK